MSLFIHLIDCGIVLKKEGYSNPGFESIMSVVACELPVRVKTNRKNRNMEGKVMGRIR